MEHHGLRRHAGPFDWYFSDFKSVLKMIETDFRDFMQKENLEVKADNCRVFYDTKYGFYCNHDIQYDFEVEYYTIYQKYMRRAERFLYDITQPTCFIRAVRSVKEIQFINQNEDYILDVITKKNPDNTILFLLLRDMEDLSETCSFSHFRLGITEYVGHLYEMWTMFESSPSFTEYCRKNILTEEDIKRNIEFERSHLSMDKKLAIFAKKLDMAAYNIIPLFQEYYPDIDRRGVFLWGAGTYGMLILRYLLRNGIKVNGIIDNDPDKEGKLCEGGVPIISFLGIRQEPRNIFISIESDESTCEIMAQIVGKYPKSRIYKLKDLINHSKAVLDL